MSYNIFEINVCWTLLLQLHNKQVDCEFARKKQASNVITNARRRIATLRMFKLKQTGDNRILRISSCLCFYICTRKMHETLSNIIEFSIYVDNALDYRNSQRQMNKYCNELSCFDSFEWFVYCIQWLLCWEMFWTEFTGIERHFIMQTKQSTETATKRSSLTVYSFATQEQYATNFFFQTRNMCHWN